MSTSTATHHNNGSEKPVARQEEAYIYFSTVGKVHKICHYAHGIYVATVERKQEFQKFDQLIVRIYTYTNREPNFIDNESERSKRLVGARIARAVAPSSDIIDEDFLDMIEIPISFTSPTILIVCQENAALCDQITYLQDKILYIKEETNFLTRKIQQIEFQQAEFHRPVKGIETNHYVNLKKLLMRRKLLPLPPPPTPSALPDIPLKSPLKTKKPVNKNVKKKQTLPVSEETCGQITSPISISADLNIQCLGEIVSDRSTFHTEDMIYPAGYISRRVYASSRNPKLKTAYTCKIIDAGLFPRYGVNFQTVSLCFHHECTYGIIFPSWKYESEWMNEIAILF